MLSHFKMNSLHVKTSTLGQFSSWYTTLLYTGSLRSGEGGIQKREAHIHPSQYEEV